MYYTNAIFTITVLRKYLLQTTYYGEGNHLYHTAALTNTQFTSGIKGKMNGYGSLRQYDFCLINHSNLLLNFVK